MSCTFDQIRVDSLQLKIRMVDSCYHLQSQPQGEDEKVNFWVRISGFQA